MATVSGYVEKIKYRNEENGYSILSVNSDGLDYVLVGTFRISVRGILLRHPDGCGASHLRRPDPGGIV